MLESCHTCRLMDLEHVRGMCTHYGLSLPDTLDSLCRNELPKGRRGKYKTWSTCHTHTHTHTHTTPRSLLYIAIAGDVIVMSKSAKPALDTV